MAQRSQVPKFGNWESEENVPYTAYFDKARKNRGGGKRNPNDSQDNPNMPPVQPLPLQQDAEQKGHKGPETVKSKHEPHTSREDGDLRIPSDSPLHPYTEGQKAVIDSSHQHHGSASSACKSESEAPNGPDALRPRHEGRLSQDDGDMRRPTSSPVRPDTTSQRTSVDSPHHRHGGISNSDTPRKVTRHSVGSDRSIEHSPLHPHYQTRVGGKGSGVSSPMWERKVSSEGSHGLAPSTPGRSRLSSVNRGDETPDHGPAVPKFGDWDENDPTSAEGFTHIFDRVREEKQSGEGKVPVMATKTSYSYGKKQYGTDNSKSCFCFPWGRK